MPGRCPFHDVALDDDGHCPVVPPRPAKLNDLANVLDYWAPELTAAFGRLTEVAARLPLIQLPQR